MTQSSNIKTTYEAIMAEQYAQLVYEVQELQALMNLQDAEYKNFAYANAGTAVSIIHGYNWRSAEAKEKAGRMVAVLENLEKQLALKSDELRNKRLDVISRLES